MGAPDDFSSNRHSAKLNEFQVPTRHPELSFDDGNVALVTGCYYFLVHMGLLRQHSEVLAQELQRLPLCGGHVLEGRPAVTLNDSAEDTVIFIRALYGFRTTYDGKNFSSACALLRLSTKYGVQSLRKEIIGQLLLAWPTTLSKWELREKDATDSSGTYSPRSTLPHPVMLIELARAVDAIELLPSALYDLLRYPPSQIVAGHTAEDGIVHQLMDVDLFKVFRGKEQAARFLSTFIVNELEGRTPSEFCLHRNEVNPYVKRACQVAFEAITFELIRDVNGMVCNRNTDPLFAIADTSLMQTREDQPGVENKAVYRACENCRLEYGAAVDNARVELWEKLPQWFELEVPNWG